MNTYKIDNKYFQLESSFYPSKVKPNLDIISTTKLDVKLVSSWEILLNLRKIDKLSVAATYFIRKTSNELQVFWMTSTGMVHKIKCFKILEDDTLLPEQHSSSYIYDIMSDLNDYLDSLDEDIEIHFLNDKLLSKEIYRFPINFLNDSNRFTIFKVI